MTEQALLSELDMLVSEGRNPRTMDIDLLSTLEIVRHINGEDHRVPAAVEKCCLRLHRPSTRLSKRFGPVAG